MSLSSMRIGMTGLGGGYDAEKPDNREYDKERQKTIDTQLKQMPQIYGGEREWQPQFADLATDVYGQSAGSLLQMLTGQFAPQMRAATSADRAADFGDLSTLGPQGRAGIDSMNPEAANLLQMLTGQAGARVNRGMSPGELRDVQQAIRGGQSARGVGYGPSDQAEEVYGVGLQSRELQRQAMQDAAGVTTLSKGFYNDPIMALFGRQGPGQQAGAQALSLAQTLNQNAGPKYINPESAYAQDLYDTNYSGQLQTRLLNAKLRQEYAKMAAKGGDSVSSLALLAT
jgi:hypothetical protein